MLDKRKQQAILQLNRAQLKSLFQGLELDQTRSEQDEEDGTAGLARLDERQQAFIQHWVGVIRRSDQGLADLFSRYAPRAFQLMDDEGVEAWLLKALAQFDTRGLGWALNVLTAVDRFADQWAERADALPLQQVANLLQHFLTGLGGRDLRIVPADKVYTDTEAVFLPAGLQSATGRDSHFQLYKAMVVHHWAQNRYGTWQMPVVEQLLRLEKSSDAFAALERFRLDACIARDFPGVFRDMQALHREYDEYGEQTLLEPCWREARAECSRASATALDSCAMAVRLTHTRVPAAACYHGLMLPQRVHPVLRARLQREKRRLRIMLGSLQDDLRKGGDEQTAAQSDLPRTRKPTEGFALAKEAGEAASHVKLQLLFDQRPVDFPEGMQELLGSIVQDLGDVPEEYFRPGGQKPYDADLHTGAEGEGGDSGRNEAPEVYKTDNVIRYREWDFIRKRYRPDYCMLREHCVEQGDPVFVADTLQRYHSLLKSIRRSFEAMLDEARLERRQSNGDGIDLDALVTARVDACHGTEMSESIYTRLHPNERSIAVMFMVDMSGSTKGWVNDAEREALVLLCEALNTIGDQYAIYGFSGRTHRRVDVYRVKQFDETYNSIVRSRIAGIKPHAYTRMGAPIRHLGSLLQRIPARNKLLVVLSDGKPEDYGSYYGRYGIEDTRHALLELRRDGVHPFCITIDKEGGDYLPYMYGVANYTCIDDVRKLPLKVADIYRKLTT